jgi:hypothetical protein
MATLGLNSIELVSALRKVPLNGSPNSQDYNDSQREVLADLSSLASFVDNLLLPLVNALPSTALLPSNAPIGIEGRTILSDTSDQTNVFFDSTASKSLSIADSLRILNGIISNVNQTIVDLGIEVAALQTRLATTNQNDIALAIQNITASLNSLTTTQNSVSSTANDNSARLARFKSKRTTTGVVSASSTKTVLVSWANAFADNSYTVSIAMEDATNDLKVEAFAFQSNGAGIEVVVTNTNQTTDRTGNIHVSAHYDPEVA